MRDFFVNGDFYLDLKEYCDYNEIELDDINDDDSLRVELSELEPVFQIHVEMLMGFIDEDRINDYTCDDILKVLQDNIDFERINSLMPNLYYPNNKFHTFTREDFINALKP